MHSSVGVADDQRAQRLAGVRRVWPQALGIPVVGLFDAHSVDSGDECANSVMLRDWLGRDEDESEPDSAWLVEGNRRSAPKCQNRRLVASGPNSPHDGVDYAGGLDCRGGDNGGGEGVTVLAVRLFER